MSITSQTSIGLDHIGMFAVDLHRISSLYERLGFSLTPVSQHASPPALGEPGVLRGTANRCAMLKHGYIELLAVIDPSLDTLGVPAALEKYQGMHILAFQTDAPEVLQSQLQEQGFSASLVYLQRQVDGSALSGLAQFTQVRTPPEQMPEGRVFALHHRTPELVWQAGHLTHPNTAQALLEVVVVVDDLAQAQQRYTRYFSCKADTSTCGQASFHLRTGTYTLMQTACYERSYPHAPLPLLPFPAVVVVGVACLSTAVQCLLAKQVPFSSQANQVRIEAEQAGGAIFILRQM